jgi:hypothetical protein
MNASIQSQIGTSSDLYTSFPLHFCVVVILFLKKEEEEQTLPLFFFVSPLFFLLSSLTPAVLLFTLLRA